MAPRFDLVPPDLPAVERYRPDLLVVEICQGQRPFSGLLEQVDWRVGGLISRAVSRGWVTGALGERVLLGAGRHLRARHLMSIGLGRPEEASSLTCNRLLDDIMEICDGLRVGSVALPLPGRSTGRIRATVAGQFLNIRVGGRALRAIAIEEPRLHAEIAAALEPEG